MRKFLLVAALVLVGTASAATANEEEFSEVEYYRKLAEKQLAEAKAEAEPEVEEIEPVVYVEPVVVAEPVVEAPKPIANAVTVVTLPPPPPPLPELSEPVYQYREVYECVECEEEPAAPKNVVVAIPQYYHSRSKDGATFDVGGQKLKMSKGRANGAGVTLLYNRKFSDLLSVAFMYEYAFMKVHSGAALPADVYDSGVRARENSRWHSNVVGVLPEFNFGKWGRFQPSLILGFDRASGTETTYLADGSFAKQDSMDEAGTNVVSLMAWYEKDFDLADGFKLTPYAGWRSLHVKVKPSDEKLWVHLVSGGLKASYQKGAVGFNMRAGVNHRTTSDDLPAYGNRAVAPGVVHFSHRANTDQTIGAFGVGVNFAIKKRAMVGVNYDAFVGKNTSAHMGSISLALPF